MKTLFSALLIFGFSFSLSQAQEQSVTKMPTITLKPSKFSMALQTLVFVDDAQGQNFELGVGYKLTESLRLVGSVGRMSATRDSSGGNLADWQYVEHDYALHSDYWIAELKYSAFQSANTRHKVLVSAGYGDMVAQLNYTYNRYKPYNGTICPFGTCTMAVEENASGEKLATIRFVRLGSNYSWEFGRSAVHFNLLAGLYYLHVLDPQNPVLGTTRKAQVGTDLIGSTLANVGFGIMF